MTEVKTHDLTPMVVRQEAQQQLKSIAIALKSVWAEATDEANMVSEERPKSTGERIGANLFH